MLGGPRFLDACRRRYGDAVTFGTLFDSQFVMVFDPALVKQVFQGSGEQLHAGEANAMLGPIVGERSVLLLDGAEHLRHRRLMLPPFHGQRMQAYADVMRESTDLEIDAWPVGEPFPLLPSMQSLTLRVIMRAVFGYEAGAAEDELRDRLRAMIEPMARPRGLMLMYMLTRRGGDRAAATRFEASGARSTRSCSPRSRRRRSDPELAERDDVFSALLLAAGRGRQPAVRPGGARRAGDAAAGRPRDDRHRPRLDVRPAAALARGAPRGRREGDAEYLDAVVKESLRLRPVIPGVGRVVRGEPFGLNGYVIPPGVEINPSIRMIHRRADLYPEPGTFRPERFLGPTRPTPTPGSRSAAARGAASARASRRWRCGSCCAACSSAARCAPATPSSPRSTSGGSRSRRSRGAGGAGAGAGAGERGALAFASPQV